MTAPSWTLHIDDFRVLDKVRWSPPPGVSLLAGPNGAGKSTLVSALRFLATAFQRELPQAIQYSGGGSAIRRLGAPERTPVRFKLEVGDGSWEILLPIEGEGVHGYYGESVVKGSEVHLRAAMYQAEFNLGSKSLRRDSRTGLRYLWDRDRPEFLVPMVAFLQGLNAYSPWWPEQVRELQTGNEADDALNARGTNIWRVLREWKQAPRRYEDRFRWVLDAARAAFPDLVTEIDFRSLGRAVQGNFYPLGTPEPTESLPMQLAADGLLQGLLHLVAVASATPGSTVVIDEVENHLHPHAIRSLIASMREWAEKQDLTVLLTTHSPLVMNEFQRDLEHFFVTDAIDGVRPAPLNEVKNPDWLAQFSLGDLYDRLKFGAPPVVQGGGSGRGDEE